MTLEATDTIGFERTRNLYAYPANPVAYEGTSGVEYKKGALVKIANGIITTHSTSDIGAMNADNSLLGIVAETKECTRTDKEVKVTQNPGEVYTVSIADHSDVTASANSTADNHFNHNLVASAARLHGVPMYIYEGPGKGDLRIIRDSSTTNNRLTIHGKWSQNPTTASKAVILADNVGTGTPSEEGLRVGNLMKTSTSAPAAKVSCKAPGVNNGYLVVLSVDPANLKADVMLAPPKSVVGHGQTAS